MLELDCENYSTSLSSLKTLLQINEDELFNFFYHVDLDKFFDENPFFNGYGSDAIYKLFSKRPVQTEYWVNWFHLTRVIGFFRHDLGILNLQEALPEIWHGLYKLVSNKVSCEEWKQYKEHIEYSNNFNARLYRSKIEKQPSDGPYAVLNPIVGFIPEKIGYHNYFRTPEIIEDICTTLDEYYDLDLQNTFERNSKPCIVKFRKIEKNGKYLKECLYFVYLCFMKKDLGHPVNTCFSGYGVSIRPEEIVDVKYPNLTKV